MKAEVSRARRRESSSVSGRRCPPAVGKPSGAAVLEHIIRSLGRSNQLPEAGQIARGSSQAAKIASCHHPFVERAPESLAPFELMGSSLRLRRLKVFVCKSIALLTQNRTSVPLLRSPGSATRSRGSAFPILEIFGFRGAEPWLRGRGIPACRSLRPGRICSVPTRPVRRPPVRSREVA